MVLPAYDASQLVFRVRRIALIVIVKKLVHRLTAPILFSGRSNVGGMLSTHEHASYLFN